MTVTYFLPSPWAGLDLVIVLPQPLLGWNDRHVLLFPESPGYVVQCLNLGKLLTVSVRNSPFVPFFF